MESVLRPRWRRFSVVIPVTMISLVLLLMVIMHFDAVRSRATQKSSGLGATAEPWDPLGLWRQSSAQTYIGGGVVGGVPGGVATGRLGGLRQQEPDSDKKLIRTVALELVVKDVRASVEQLRRATESMGGEIETLGVAEREDGVRSGGLKVRVPSNGVESALAEFKKVAVCVQREEIQARDVTREYADNEARLRNMKAEEEQYLTLLKRAGSMKDTLEVTQKLNEVRGEIERMQADLNYTAHQVAMSAVDISLIQESEAQVAGLRWRPLYNAKLAAREMLSGLADWVDFLVALLLKLPLIIVWLVTVVVLAAMVWKAVRWMWKRFFPQVKVGFGKQEGTT